MCDVAEVHDQMKGCRSILERFDLWVIMEFVVRHLLRFGACVWVFFTKHNAVCGLPSFLTRTLLFATTLGILAFAIANLCTWVVYMQCPLLPIFILKYTYRRRSGMTVSNIHIAFLRAVHDIDSYCRGIHIRHPVW